MTTTRVILAEARKAKSRALLSGTSAAAAASHRAYVYMTASMSMVGGDVSVMTDLLKSKSLAL
ncbi:hypothetical protein [Sphingobium yanoikuyae]|uniref:hypothetical protein n=1 Tax=Sphingobium yanoikuyae TaxID=13690 RepID=UPI00055EF628|nr:hypothetical protein [Sphingobium yanoikuyae]